MKTIDIPEPEATKLRLIRELPFVVQVPIDRIIQDATDWDNAIYGIDKYLSAIINDIDSIKAIHAKFILPGPIGELRKEQR